MPAVLIWFAALIIRIFLISPAQRSGASIRMAV
jgi:hypothetical protein